MGVLAGIVTALLFQLDQDNVYGLIIGFALAIASVIIYGLGTIDRSARVRTPVQVLARDRAACVILCVSTALLLPFTAAVIRFIAGQPLDSIVDMALFSGISYGLPTGTIVAIASTAWPRYIVARCHLALTGRLPWQLMAFLSDAHIRYGVLRQNGTTYQYRHLGLQHRLASRYATEYQQSEGLRPGMPPPPISARSRW